MHAESAGSGAPRARIATRGAAASNVAGNLARRVAINLSASFPLDATQFPMLACMAPSGIVSQRTAEPPCKDWTPDTMQQSTQSIVTDMAKPLSGSIMELRNRFSAPPRRAALERRRAAGARKAGRMEIAMKLLVTGATGKVGSSLIDRLRSGPRASQMRIRALCHNRILAEAPGLEVVKGTISDRECNETARWRA